MSTSDRRPSIAQMANRMNQGHRTALECAMTGKALPITPGQRGFSEAKGYRIVLHTLR